MKAIPCLTVALLLCAGSTDVRPAAAAADSPSVVPASGGAGVPLIFGHFDDLDAIGYETAEYFVAGDAHAYSTSEPLTEDGRWNAVAPDPSTAAYLTRVIVHTPKNPRRFNGTVYVEWFNVTGLADASPDWVHGHLQIAREGAAYVGVSAQAAGVNQLKVGGPLPDIPGDPERYAPLAHPGDSYSFDIFSQAGQAIRDGALLKGRTARRVLAMGESQSAGRLVTYINAIHPLVDVYDGFLVHSRNRGGAALSQEPLPSVPVARTDIRDDLDAPVIVFQAETDVANAALLARQPETRGGKFRLWEVAGTAHFDVYGLVTGLSDTGDGQAELAYLATMQDPPRNPQPGLIECELPINVGPMHWVFNAAVHWINRWAKHGTPPPIAPRLETTTGPGVEPVVFAVDEHGNTLGGIRTPYVDVPIASLGGTGNGPGPGAPGVSQFCSIFGRTVPFTDAELAALYPNHGSFVARYYLAAVKAVSSGFLLRPDAVALFRAAARSDIGR
jgi:hypothetical protein